MQNTVCRWGILGAAVGCRGDLGWYCIRFALWAMNWELPESVAACTLTEHRTAGDTAAIPTDFSAELFFAHGVSAGFFYSFLAQIQQWTHIAGAKGALYVPDFVLPRHGEEVEFEISNLAFSIEGCDFILEDRVRRIALPEYSHCATDAQETNMVHTFAKLALSGKPDPCWGEMALKTQQVLDVCLESAQSSKKGFSGIYVVATYCLACNYIAPGFQVRLMGSKIPENRLTVP